MAWITTALITTFVVTVLGGLIVAIYGNYGSSMKVEARKKKDKRKKDKKNFNKTKKDFPKLMRDIKDRCIEDGKIKTYTYEIDFSNTERGHLDNLVNECFDKIDLDNFSKGLNQLYQDGLISDNDKSDESTCMCHKTVRIRCTISRELMELLLKEST